MMMINIQTGLKNTSGTGVDYPIKRKLSDVLSEIGDCTELADSIENVSREMRKSQMREVNTSGTGVEKH
jgi:hypothetical protein